MQGVGTDEVVGTRTIVVAGVGFASAVPDECVLTISLKVMRDTVADAVDEVAALAGAAIAALRDQGVADSDVRTVNVGVQDWFDHQQQRVTARVATYTLTVHGRRLADVPVLIRRLTTAAGDALHIDGIGFAHSDPGPLRAAARADAVADARSRAEQLAAAAGLRVGGVLNISEGAEPGDRWFGRAVSFSARAAAAPEMPVQPGDLRVTVRVEVAYALEPPG